MNRVGLFLALLIAVAIGGVFAFDPRLDLEISGLFYDPATHSFAVNAEPWVRHARDAARGIITLLVAPAFFAALLKLIWPHKRMLIPGRAALLLALTLALGPGIIANVILKDHWGRVRPADVTEFGGHERFTPWWDPRGTCPNNCAFVAGEPSGAFWTLAPAALVPPQWRALAYAGALAFGVALGLLRMAAGAHFFTDVIFAGVFMFLLIWIVHGLLYRWPRTPVTDAAIERPFTQAGEALRRAFGALAGRRGAGKRLNS